MTDLRQVILTLQHYSSQFLHLDLLLVYVAFVIAVKKKGVVKRIVLITKTTHYVTAV